MFEFWERETPGIDEANRGMQTSLWQHMDIWQCKRHCFSKHLRDYLSSSQPLNASQRLCVVVHDAKCEAEKKQSFPCNMHSYRQCTEECILISCLQSSFIAAFLMLC